MSLFHYPDPCIMKFEEEDSFIVTPKKIWDQSVLQLELLRLYNKLFAVVKKLYQKGLLVLRLHVRTVLKT